jgi:hypothetical protein
MDRATERDIQKLRDKIDADLKDSQRREEAMAKETAKREALYDTTVGIIKAEIKGLLDRNSQMIVDKVKMNASAIAYYNNLTSHKKTQLLIRATKMAADEFFKDDSPFFRSSQENSQENGLHILLQLPKNMQ